MPWAWGFAAPLSIAVEISPAPSDPPARRRAKSVPLALLSGEHAPDMQRKMCRAGTGVPSPALRFVAMGALLQISGAAASVCHNTIAAAQYHTCVILVRPEHSAPPSSSPRLSVQASTRTHDTGARTPPLFAPLCVYARARDASIDFARPHASSRMFVFCVELELGSVATLYSTNFEGISNNL